MSKVKIQGNASGTGVLTVTAPNTSTDRTITLPDATGELLSTAGGTMTGDLTIGTVGSVTSSGADLKITGTDDIFFNVAGATNNILQLYGGSSANDQSKFDSHVHPLTDNSKDLGNSSERWKDLYLSGGLKVGGTDAAHTLDDYEEGTWTPMVTDLTNNATMHSLSAGVYTKIGRVVHFSANVRTNGLGSVSGNLYISGLPFSNANTNGNHSSAATSNAENMSITADTSIHGYIGKNGSTVRLDSFDTTGGVSVLQASEFTAYGQIVIGGTYFT